MDGDLFQAADDGNYQQIKKMLSPIFFKPNVNKFDSDGYTPLYYACSSGFIETVDLLLKNKANVNVSCADVNITPLYIACQNNHTEVVKSLVNKGADVNTKCLKENYSSLQISTENNNYEVVKCLLKSKADPNVHDNSVEKMTPLFKACSKGFSEIVELLLEHGAEPNTCCLSNNSSPLLNAVINKNYKIAMALLNHGADC